MIRSETSSCSPRRLGSRVSSSWRSSSGSCRSCPPTASTPRGVAAAEGAWGLPAAIVLSVLGSGAGAFATYRIGIRIAAGEEQAMRIRRLLRRRDRLGRYLRRMQRRSGAVPFVAQLLPAARLVAPLIAGATPHDWRRLSIATLAGLTVWNTIFIAIGFVMVQLGGPTNATVVSATILAALAGSFVVTRLAKHRLTAFIHKGSIL